jgi:hypothetical protein
VKNAARNSPWIVMAVALHLILIAIATVFYTTHEKAEALDERFVVEPQRQRPVEEVLLPPEVVRDRHAIPTNDEIDLETPKDYVATDTVASDTEPLGEETGNENAPPGIEFASTAITVGDKGPGYRSSRVSALRGTRPFVSGKGKDNGQIKRGGDVGEDGVLAGPLGTRTKTARGARPRSASVATPVTSATTRNSSA